MPHMQGDIPNAPSLETLQRTKGQGVTDETEFWAIAAQVCTTKELQALTHRAAGYGKRKTARMLGISPTTVKDRLDSAHRKIRAEQERKTAA